MSAHTDARLYHDVGKDGKTVLSRDLEDERDAIEAENEKLREAGSNLMNLFRLTLDDPSRADEFAAMKEMLAALERGA